MLFVLCEMGEEAGMVRVTWSWSAGSFEDLMW